MHRVELKDGKVLIVSFVKFLFLMHRVELKDN